MCVCVCVCVKERDRDRERQRQKKTEAETEGLMVMNSIKLRRTKQCAVLKIFNTNYAQKRGEWEGGTFIVTHH